MRDSNSELISAILKTLVAIESKNEIVITSSSPISAASELAETVKGIYVGEIFTTEELLALSSLIFHAVHDKRFYDWEMPTLIGYTAEEMQKLGEKIRESINQ